MEAILLKKITLGPRDVAQLVECVSSIHKLQDWPSAPYKLSALVQEASKLKVTLNYTGSWKPVWAWTLDPVFDNEEMGRSFEYIKPLENTTIPKGIKTQYLQRKQLLIL